MKKNLSNIYTTNDYINFNESSYDNTKSAYYERALIISDFIKKNKIKSVLDVGCSTGSLIKFLKKRNKQTVFYGCDISPAIINKVKKDTTLDDKYFFVDDAAGLKTSKCFDLILCFGLIQFMPNSLKVIKKFSKNLNKNAYLVIATQNFLFTFISFNQIAANFLKKVTNLKNKKFLEISKYFIKNNNKYNVNNYFTPNHNNIEILNTLNLSEYFKEKNYEINYVYSDYYNYHSKFLRTNKKNFTSQKNKWKKFFFSSAALHIFKKTL